MKRLIFILAAFFTFSTALVSCREEGRVDDEVEIEADDDGVEVDDGALEETETTY